MDNAMPLQDWADFIGEEYLESFIKAGGASIKFAVTPERLNNDLALAVAEQAKQRGCEFVEIDAAVARVHMPQDIFFAIALQLDWRLLTRRVIVELARGLRYRTEDVCPSNGGNIYESLGRANGIDTMGVLQELRPAIQEKIFRNRSMARDFRTAMSHLCLIEANSGSGEYGGQPLIDWLTGVNTRISNVRHFSVHTPINRTTARHFLESALFWIRQAGYGGVIILLDNTRVTLPRRPEDGSRFYTKAMVIDHYELLRELIDSADRLSGVLVAVLANPDFLNDDTRSRGFGAYPALMTRVMNDVHDKNLVNPMASLVRLSDTEEER